MLHCGLHRRQEGATQLWAIRQQVKSEHGGGQQAKYRAGRCGAESNHASPHIVGVTLDEAAQAVEILEGRVQAELYPKPLFQTLRDLVEPTREIGEEAACLGE